MIKAGKSSEWQNHYLVKSQDYFKRLEGKRLKDWQWFFSRDANAVHLHFSHVAHNRCDLLLQINMNEVKPKAST